MQYAPLNQKRVSFEDEEEEISQNGMLNTQNIIQSKKSMIEHLYFVFTKTKGIKKTCNNMSSGTKWAIFICGFVISIL